jgi:hypothetical protein
LQPLISFDILAFPLSCAAGFLAVAIAGFGLPEGPLKLQCLRLASKERHKDLAAFFPAKCTAAVDEQLQQEE